MFLHPGLLALYEKVLYDLLMRSDIAYLRLISLTASLAVVGVGSAQVTYPGFDASQHTSELPWTFIGWRKDAANIWATHLVFDTELNGFGAIERHARYAVRVTTNRFARIWKFGDDASQVPLPQQSATWLNSHPHAGMGTTAYQFPGPYFPGDRAPKIADLTTRTSFTSNGVSYDLQLNHFTSGPIERDPDGNAGFHRAIFSLKIKRPGSGWKILQKDVNYHRNCLVYGIDRIVISPTGKHIAVFLARYSAGWFEGWNVAAERMVVTGTLP